MLFSPGLKFFIIYMIYKYFLEVFGLSILLAATFFVFVFVFTILAYFFFFNLFTSQVKANFFTELY